MTAAESLGEVQARLGSGPSLPPPPLFLLFLPFLQASSPHPSPSGIAHLPPPAIALNRTPVKLIEHKEIALSAT